MDNTTKEKESAPRTTLVATFNMQGKLKDPMQRTMIFQDFKVNKIDFACIQETTRQVQPTREYLKRARDNGQIETNCEKRRRYRYQEDFPTFIDK